MIYMVEMALLDTGRRAEWEAWYVGHQHRLLSVPGIRASQRFEALRAAASPFVALHEVDSPEVFTGPAYRAKAGPTNTGEWQTKMGNWHRADAPQTPGDRMIRLIFLVMLALVVAVPSGYGAPDIDRIAVDFKTPSEIKWVRNAAGTNESAVLFGDPSKPGPYVVRVKWFPGNMSRPHFHPNDRFFAVLSGTWWMGTGQTFDPESTVPVPAGSYVIHYGGKVHYDGAKSEETVIQVWGMGPATSTPAEKR